MKTANEALAEPGWKGLRLAIGALDGVNSLCKIVCGLLLAVATLSVTWQILVRFVLDALGMNISAPWTEEVARYSFIWAVFIGVGVISRHAGLIAVEMLPQLLPPPYGKWVKLLAIGTTIAFFVAAGQVGYHFAVDGMIETSPVLRVPMAWVYSALPVGAALTVLNLLALALEGILLGRDIAEASDPDFVAE